MKFLSLTHESDPSDTDIQINPMVIPIYLRLEFCTIAVVANLSSYVQRSWLLHVVLCVRFSHWL